MSLRLRLTVMYSMILALALVSFSAVIYVVTSRLSQRVMEDSLATEASRLIQEPKFRLGKIVVPNDSTGVPYIFFVQTRDINGKFLDKSWLYTGIALPMTADTLAMTLEGHVVYTRVKIGDLSLLVFNGPIYEKQTGVLLGFIQVARSVGDFDEALRVLETAAAAAAYAVQQICVCGGVSANTCLRTTAERRFAGLKIPFSIPPFAYCTDNAAMVGAAAFYRWREEPNLGRDLQVDVHATLPLPGTE